MNKKIIPIFIFFMIISCFSYNIYANSEEPDITSDAAILIDSNTTKTLYSKKVGDLY